jgi:hypothetical protein
VYSPRAPREVLRNVRLDTMNNEQQKGPLVPRDNTRFAYLASNGRAKLPEGFKFVVSPKSIVERAKRVLPKTL